MLIPSQPCDRRSWGILDALRLNPLGALAAHPVFREVAPVTTFPATGQRLGQ
jgi:hypothetical protein